MRSGSAMATSSCSRAVSERLFVIAPVHNRRPVTEEFARCVSGQTINSYRLVLVDDGSTDGTADAVRNIVPDVVVIRGAGDWWWARSLERGLSWVREQTPAPNDIVLFINDDVHFEPSFFESGLASLRGRPRTLLLARFGSAASPGDTAETGVHADFTRLTFEVASDPSTINCLSTRGLFVRWQDIQEIGNFRPRVLPHYLSDYEYTIRAHRRGMACVTDESVWLIPRLDTTGFHSFGRLSLRSFIAAFFSRRSAANPITWTAFVIVASPLRWKFINVLRVWRRAASAILGAARAA